MSDDYISLNRKLWDSWAKLHQSSESDYADAIQRVRSGGLTLSEDLIHEVGNVEGTTLLHLQCHLGLDSISWARLGAKVTGVDFSTEAIEFARSLIDESDERIDFICSDIYDLPEQYNRSFDIVFTSDGVLIWLQDLNRWAESIYRVLKPGGFLILHDFHPFRRLFIPKRVDADGNVVAVGYFPTAEPVIVKEKGSYAITETDQVHEARYWSHSLGEIITSLCDAGLRINFFHERPKLANHLQTYVLGINGEYEVRLLHQVEIPNSFTIKASKT